MHRTRCVQRRQNLDERGVSLIEVLIALFLISVLVIALVNGLLTSTKATTVSNRSQRTGAALTSFGETLRQMDYKECADAAWYQADYDYLLQMQNSPTTTVGGGAATQPPLPMGVGAMDTIKVDSVKYWQPGTFSDEGPWVPGKFIDNCDDPSGGAQLLTFTVTMGENSETGQLVKRDPYAEGFLAATTTIPPLSEDEKAPVAVLYADPVTGAAPLTVNFDGSDSYKPEGSIQSYSWDFGDNSGGSTDAETSHTFAAGRYQVILTVTGSDLRTATARKTIIVTGAPPTPTGLKKVGQGAGSIFGGGYIDLRWDAVPGIDAYQVQTRAALCSTDTVDAGRSNAARISKNTWCSFTGLFQFDARVRARVGTDWSPWSAWVNVKWTS